MLCVGPGQAQYFIPILGMLLGNAISGVSVGLSTLLEELARLSISDVSSDSLAIARD